MHSFNITVLKCWNSITTILLPSWYIPGFSSFGTYGQQNILNGEKMSFNRYRKGIQMLILILIFIGLGFLRDTIFVSINTHLYYLKPGAPAPFTPLPLPFLGNFSFTQLYYSKYPLTIFFTAIHLVLILFALWKLYRDKVYMKITVGLYLFLGLLSLLLFVGGFATGNVDQWYRFSRIIMGILQSPALLLALIAARPLYLKNRESQRKFPAS